jgi:sulfatase modifying factor 1
MNRALASAGLASVFAVLQVSARAEHRAALLIGNSDYPKAPLSSPARDIRAIGDALQQRGFVVTLLENLNAAEMREAWSAFAWSIPTRGTALVYFSGYALPLTKDGDPQADNALLPVDGNASNPGTVALSQTGLNRLLGALARDSGSARNILIVDGCYAHPAQAKAAPKGLVSPAKPAPESLVLFGAPPGELQEPAAQGLSPLAKQFSEGLLSGKPLDAVLAQLGSAQMSTVEDLQVLALPASRAVAPPTEPPASAKPGDEWVNDRGMVFCWCPPGKFTIGSPESAQPREEDETAAEIEFAQGFWMAKFEFTRREMAGMAPGVYLSTGEHKLHPLNKIHFGNNFQTAQVDQYLQRLNHSVPPGWSYDLPTEAEWEYAARAGTSTDYFFGNDPAALAQYGNFADRTLRESDSFGELPKNWKPKAPGIVYFGDRQGGTFSYAHKTWDDGHATMAPVGSFPPNPWGLHDVHGNLAELTSTPYHPRRLPVEAGTVIWGVAKGGSWLSTAAYCRSAIRLSAHLPENGVGLRFILRRTPASTPQTLSQKSVPLLPTHFHSEAGATAEISPDGTVLVGGKSAKDTYTLTAVVPAGITPKAIQLKALPDAGLPNQGPGRAASGAFTLCEFSVQTGVPGAREATRSVEILDVSADFNQPGMRLSDVIDGQAQPNTGWGTSGASGKEHTATFSLALPSRQGADGALWKPPSTSTGGPVAGGLLVIRLEHQDAATLGKFRLSLLHEAPEQSATSTPPARKSAP